MVSINLVDLVEKMGVKLTKHGHEWRGPCPLHQGTSPTSFVIREKNGQQFWRCYSKCQDAGGSIKFIMLLHNFTYKQALEYLGGPRPELVEGRILRQAQPAPAAAPPPGPQWQAQAWELIDRAQRCLWSTQGNRARQWLNARGLDDKSIEIWQLGFIPADTWEPLEKWGLLTEGKKVVWLPRGILIPGVTSGTVWYLKIRRADGQPKTPQILGSKPALFGSIGLHSTAVMVEGEFDAMLLHQEAGDITSVATCGAAGHLPKGEWLKQLYMLQRIIVVGDSDQAGQRHNEKWQQFSQRVTIAKVPAGKDITDYWKAGGNLRQWAAFCLAQAEKQRPQQSQNPPRIQNTEALEQGEFFPRLENYYQQELTQ